MKKEILVSIWCITYNHESYIRNAIEGFLMQKTDFAYEIIIHDDASTDKTAEIIREYERKYPDLIRGIYETENQHRQNISNIRWLLNIEQNNCKGKYIAVCEGDDYWIDCHKLQIQADYMEAHTECSLCIHNALQFNCQDGSTKSIDPYECDMEMDVDSEEIIMQYRGHPPTASMFHRRELIEMPALFCESPVGDYPLLLYALEKGKIHYNSRIMSVYRWLSEESYNSRLALNREFEFYFDIGLIILLDRYDQFTNYEHHIWLINRIQHFALRAIAIVDADVSFEKQYKECEKKGYYLTSGYKKYFGGIERLRKQISDLTYCSEKIRRFAKAHKYIVIMGKGKYGTIVANQLENNEIKFCGFVVSQKMQGEDFYMEKPVWTLSEIPFEKEDAGVIIAINPTHWNDILDSLKNAEIIHYICPFFVK